MNYSRQGTRPVVVALGAMIVFVVSFVLITGSIWMQKREKRRQAEITAAFRDAT
jgi:ABC-type spermidine/putrescine transport system permease subunit II